MASFWDQFPVRSPEQVSSGPAQGAAPIAPPAQKVGGLLGALGLMKQPDGGFVIPGKGTIDPSGQFTPDPMLKQNAYNALQQASTKGGILGSLSLKALGTGVDDPNSGLSKAYARMMNRATGRIHLIPHDQVAAAQQAGGQVVP